MKKKQACHVYIIYKGQWQTKDFHEIAEYRRKDFFIKRLRQLGYEKYYGQIHPNDTEFVSTFGDYHIIIF